MVRIILKVLLLKATILLSFNLHGGWIITEKSGDGAQLQKLYIQENKLKVMAEDSHIIFNMNTDEMTIISSASNNYWKGTIEDYKNSILIYVEEQLSRAMEEADEDQKETIQQLYENTLTELKASLQNRTELPKPFVEIRETSETTTIIGYSARKYEIWVNGNHKEDLYMTNEIRPFQEFDFEKLMLFASEFQVSNEEDLFVLTDEYLELASNNYPLRTIDYTFGENISEVIEIEEKQIPESEFAPPEGYVQVSVAEIIGNE